MIYFLSLKSGKLQKRVLSILPGLSKARSIKSGLADAAKTKTPSLPSTPSR
jgi:hypothetical protein